MAFILSLHTNGMLYSHIHMGVGLSKTSRSFAPGIWLSALLGLLLFAQIIRLVQHYDHDHHQDAAELNECVACTQGAQNDDFDAPAPIAHPLTIFLDIWSSNHTPKKITRLLIKAKARGPPLA
jgi:hypothetical protein